MTIEERVDAIENLLSQLIPEFLTMKLRLDTINLMMQKESLNKLNIGESDIKKLIKRTRS